MEDWLGSSLAVFVGLTLVLVGGAAALAGRAIAREWKPLFHVLAAAFGLALADRFLVYALFQGELLHLRGFLIAFAVIAAIGALSWRLTRVECMVRQYPWKYRKRGPFSWTEIRPEPRH